MTTAVARVAGLSKTFGATRALRGVDFAVAQGELHALVGENGAGKSTLVRILGGIHRPDEGTLEIDGHPRRFSSPREAIAGGVVTIPQELRLVPAMSVAENLTLADPPLRSLPGVRVIDRARMREVTRAELARLDFAPDPDTRLDRLGFAERQLVAIAKALRQRCRLLILDEPTAALETHEVERLFSVLARMKAEGTAMIYVSHRLDEVVALADRCTVLRDGSVVASHARGGFVVADLVEAMTGRAEEGLAVAAAEPGPTRLADGGDRERHVEVRAHEVVGLAGLLGSGTDRMLKRLFGVGGERAAVTVDGCEQRIDTPADAIRAGIGMVPGERRLGLVMGQSVRDNILLPSLDRLSRGGRLDRTAGDRVVAGLMELVDIRPRDPAARVSTLSGGNQQKVILAKWLAREVGVLLLDEPTQGVDVGAKAQIHKLVRDFAAKGGGVLVASSDLAELSRLCDGVLAVRNGRVTARIERAEGFDDKRLHAAIGG